MKVLKRSGKQEDLNIDKIHRVCSWACDDINNVSVSELEIKAQIQFYENISTSDIQETLIKSAADLITEDTPNYQYVAGRLVNYHLRKMVYDTFKPTRLYDHVKRVIDLGMYTPELLDWYTEAEYDTIESDILDHTRDFLITYAGMEQFRGKYLVKNRVTNTIVETPQMAFILIAMILFKDYKEDRLTWVTNYYDAISQFDISLPTPIMAGVRTPTKQFSSCVLIETDDSLDSMNAAASAVVKYVSKRAGIGLGLGRIRAIGSPIRGGEVTHTGVIPFIKYFQSAVKSSSQGGLRGGAATAYFPCWHYEIEDIIVLKNNKGTENNRARQLDYGIQFNKVMYERLLSNGNITLFSPSDVPGMYEAFFNDVDKFRDLYEAAEKDESIRKKTVTALHLFSTFLQERKDTGRIYLMNVDHVNDHGSFDKSVAPIHMSNLCTEITLPTYPLNDINDGSPIRKILKFTKEEYQKYLIWKQNNPNSPIYSN